MPTERATIIDDAWACRVSAGVAARSRRALEELYEARFERLFKIVRDRTRRDDAFALDCVQDAWIRVVRSLPAVESLASLDCWLARAVLSVALDRIRGDAARARRETERPKPVTDDNAELITMMERELNQLSTDDRSVIDLRFRRHLTLERVGTTLGISMKAAEIRLRRALARLRSHMEVPRDS